MSQHYIHQMALCVHNHADVLPNDTSVELPSYACLLGNILESSRVALSQPDCSFELVSSPMKFFWKCIIFCLFSFFRLLFYESAGYFFFDLSKLKSSFRHYWCNYYSNLICTLACLYSYQFYEMISYLNTTV